MDKDISISGLLEVYGTDEITVNTKLVNSEKSKQDLLDEGGFAGKAASLSDEDEDDDDYMSDAFLNKCTDR